MKKMAMMMLVTLAMTACAHKHGHKGACGEGKTECSMEKKSDCACGKKEKTEEKKP